MQLNNGAPIAGVTVVTFKAVVSPKPSTDGTVTWRFTDDGSTGTGATITHVFAPRLPGGPGAPGLCPVADPTSGGWVVYQASASFSGFPFKDQDVALPVVTRTLTGMWIDDPKREILSISSVGTLVCGASQEGANARVSRIVGTIDSTDARVVAWDRVPDTEGGCVEHHRAVVDPNLTRLVGDVVVVEPTSEGSVCGAAASHGTWTRCETGIDCTVR